MKAVYIKVFGDVTGLEITEMPAPSLPVGSEIIVRVASAGLNRADVLQRKGLYPPPAGVPDRIPGLEFSGRVSAIGETVTDFKQGDEVFGIVAGGAQAEFVKTSSAELMRVPKGLGLTEAGAVPEAFITAFDALFLQAKASRGSSVLIHAAASGVGLAAMQLALAFELKPIGTTRSIEKATALKALGFEHIIIVDDSNQFSNRISEITQDHGVNFVLDLVGAPYLEESIKSLSLNGTMMMVGLTGGRVAKLDLGLILNKRVTLKGTVLRSRTPEEKSLLAQTFMRDVTPLFSSGVLKPNIDRVFSYGEIAEAHRYLESNSNIGKVLLNFE